MSDSPRQSQSDLPNEEALAQGTRADPVRSDASYAQRRLTAERYILHRRPGREPKADTQRAADTRPESTSVGAETAGERRLAGRYLLGPRIGSGRFGPIYQAEDASVAEHAPNRHVAVQLLWSELGKHDWLVKRFGRELARLKTWQHENIVQVLDFGRDGTRFFWVTELLDGASLRSILAELSPELLEESEARAVIGGVGAALLYAHDRNKIHGAINLENVFVTTDMVVKVLDFAPVPIAPSTPLFANDIKASSRKASARDDVYGLACVAYELLAGHHPYHGSLPEEARRGGLKPERIEGLPRRRWRALARGLATEPAKRTPSVSRFLKRLRIDAGETLAPARTVTRKRAASRTHRFSLRWLAYTTILAGLASFAYVAYELQLSILIPADVWGRASERVQAMWMPQEPDPSRLASENRTEDANSPIENTAPGPAAVPAGSALGSSGGDAEAPEPSVSNPVDSPVGVEEDVASPTIDRAVDDAALTANAPSVDAPQTRSLAAPAVAPPADESGFEFTQERLLVDEDAAVARLVIRRTGSTAGEAQVTWRTIEDTAVADEDYANFGRVVETFADGESSRTILIPLVGNSVAERAKRFYVDLSQNSVAGDHMEARAEVVILDDD